MLTANLSTYVKYVNTFACQNYLHKIVLLCIFMSACHKQICGAQLSYVNSSDTQMYWHILHMCAFYIHCGLLLDLSKKIHAAQLNPDMLVGKYIPNLVAKKFNVSQEYVQLIYDQTSSHLDIQSYYGIPLHFCYYFIICITSTYGIGWIIIEILKYYRCSMFCCKPKLPTSDSHGRPWWIYNHCISFGNSSSYLEYLDG